MSSFLYLLAKDLLQKHREHFDQLTIVLPNKRAGVFLAEELSSLIDKPQWMPEIYTLNEFIGQHAGLKKAEPLPLTIKLYKVYQAISGSTERFEDFYFWGNMLLEDFDDIDKYLADAKSIFSNLVALKEIELRFPYLTPEQIEAIQMFWSSFNPEKFSQEQQQFINVWEKLYPTYLEFKKQLFHEEVCYEGMGQRYFLENIEKFTTDQHLVFAGFNALSKCEKKIFTFYRNNGQASFYWDYDIYYTSDINQEAGNHIREDLKDFPNELGQEHFNNLKYNDKKVEFISVPSAIGQAKLIPTLLNDFEDIDRFNTAIILCDERMLIPTIHSIPDNIRKINVTMGYPARNTSVAAFISILGELKDYSKKEGEETFYYYKPVISLLNHKFSKDFAPEDIDKITNYIHQKNIVYISEKNLRFNAFTQEIFSPDEEKLTTYLLRVLKFLCNTFDNGKETIYPIEKEFIFTFLTFIQSLQNTFEEEQIEPDSKLYMQIINKVIHTTTIPFSGEPLEGLQIMGLQETRMLDFKNLIILSANEGILPKNKTISSFIPYNLRIGFNLPTPEFQDSLFAYYFYRLIQRASHIKILYNTIQGGLTSGEMSRYLYQLKYESGLAIKELCFQNQITTQGQPVIEIEKNKETLAMLDLYTQSQEKTLSPSALNTYLECPMRFYFKYIAEIKEKDEIAEELDQRMLGNIFHECSQSLYATIPGGHITTEDINHLLDNEKLIEQHINTSYNKLYDQRVSKLIDSGSNELILDIIKKYLREMFTYDKQFCPFQLLAMEQKFHFPIEINTSDGKKQIFVGGYIDRVDHISHGIRVIDYKTGADTTTFKNLEAVFDPEAANRNKAAFQTMLYCLMYEHRIHGDQALIPGIYSIKLLFKKNYNYMLQCDKDNIHNFNTYREDFWELFTRLLEEIYDPSRKFTQTTVPSKCRTCVYNDICRR